MIPEPTASYPAGRWKQKSEIRPSRGFLPSLSLFGVPISRKSVVLVLGDVAVLAAATYVGHYLRWIQVREVKGLAEIIRETTGAATVFACSVLLFLYLLDCYSWRLDFRKPAAMLRLAAALAAASVLQMAIFYLAPRWRWFRGETILTLAVLAALLALWRALASIAIQYRLGPVPVLIVGSSRAAVTIADVLEDHAKHGHAYRFVGSVSDTRQADDTGLLILGSSAELLELVRDHGVSEIIVANRDTLTTEMKAMLLSLKTSGVQIVDMPTAYRRLTGKVPVAELDDAWVIFGPDFRGVRPLYKGLLRLADVLLAIVGFVLGLPFLLLSAVAIKLTSKGPVFFIQERAGLHERSFKLIKLRTMKADAEAKTGPVWSWGEGDTRVTPVGRFLRASRIDEIPQLWNVVRGEMSMVGPRPERPLFVEQLKNSIPYYGLRFAVKPGLTGWAQVRYRYGANEEDALEKLQYELYSIQEMSPVLYLVILLKTVQTVLMRPGASVVAQTLKTRA